MLKGCWRLPMVVLLLAVAPGCVGEIRETTTARTATEQLLLSTAAERAIARLGDLDGLVRGRRVHIDDARFVSVDSEFVISALRHHVADRGGLLVQPPPGGEDKPPPPELVLEVRSAALGIKDTSWGVGIPALPLPIPQTTMITTTPPAYLFYRGKQEGWAKLQLWIYDPATRRYIARSKVLWGHSYYSTWWVLFVGPFDWSNDVYPEEEALEKPPPEDGAQGGSGPGKGQDGHGGR